MRKNLLLLALIAFYFVAYCQKAPYTRQDSLRGSITNERSWWDLLHYDLYVSVDIDNKSISGRNIVKYKVLKDNNLMQIDLQPPMQIDQVTQNEKVLKITHEGNVHFVQLLEEQTIGDIKKLEITFSGTPIVARFPPWDGGFTWAKDSTGNHFIATSCQGLGASAWWPNKDHYYDEPDEGILLSINVPESLTAVGNGRLVETVKDRRNTRTYVWEVINPINNYGVNVNIGDYVNFKDVYQGEKGPLDLSFWVLRGNLERAKEHFKDAYRTLEAFEYWFGPYPFYEDSYKLVEVPYQGMEHQSSVTYGNRYMKGYLGKDLSLTGWGLKWDYIIVHETGHEWFANSITHEDPADLWIHEGFTFYSECLFTEYYYGKQAGYDYVKGARNSIQNREPIIGDYGVNDEGADVYMKGANVLHTLRQLIEDDSLWRSILRGLNKDFYHQVVNTVDIEEYIAEKSGLDLDSFWDQYLRDPRVPVLEYFLLDGSLTIRWTNCIPEFVMPIKVNLSGKTEWIQPRTSWTTLDLEDDLEELEVDPEFYVYTNHLVIDQMND